MTQKRVLILHAPGTNRDGDLAQSISAAGGIPEIVPLTQLSKSERQWQNYAMLALPGGFSYGDALGAGRLWALDLQTWFADLVATFVHNQRPVIGICNGFQALVKAGVLPGKDLRATLTFNASGHFECRWVKLRPHPTNPSPWLDDLAPIYCPVAHGEGRFLQPEGQTFPNDQIALTYIHPDGRLARGAYPANPNGSLQDIAGITNSTGNILGLMPHPENHIYPFQHPNWTRGQSGGMGIKLFENGLSMG